MKIKGNALGVSMGIVWGGTVFLATIVLIIKAKLAMAGVPGMHYETALGIGPTLGKLGQFYLGYSVTVFGSIVGFIYGFVHAYITGFIIAWIYNRFAGD